MVIGLCYDLKNTYGISEDLLYNDFSFLSEVEFVEKTLRKLGHKVILINGLNIFVKNIIDYKHKCDLIFNMIEGYKSRNREGLLPALCEAFDILYTGTDAFGLSLSLNKYHMSHVVRSFNIKTPSSYLIEYPIKNNDFAEKHTLGYPCVIKPNQEGSSGGVNLVNSPEFLIEKASILSETYKQPLVVEKYIKGLELSVGILGTGSKARVYTCFEFVNNDGSNIELFDYECKYNTGFKTILPRLDRKIIDLICEQSLFIHRQIGFRDISRIDWRVRKNTPYFIEATPLPALDVGSDFDLGSKYHGETFETVLNEVLLSAMSRGKV